MTQLPPDLIIDLLTLDEAGPAIREALGEEWPAFQKRMLEIVANLPTEADPDTLAREGLALFELWRSDPRVWAIVQPVRLRLVQARGYPTAIAKPEGAGPGPALGPKDLINALRLSIEDPGQLTRNAEQLALWRQQAGLPQPAEGPGKEEG